MNPCGSSLVYGHSQAPTGTRGVAELIETLRLRGGAHRPIHRLRRWRTGPAVVLRVDFR